MRRLNLLKHHNKNCKDKDVSLNRLMSMKKLKAPLPWNYYLIECEHFYPFVASKWPSFQFKRLHFLKAKCKVLNVAPFLSGNPKLKPKEISFTNFGSTVLLQEWSKIIVQFWLCFKQSLKIQIQLESPTCIWSLLVPRNLKVTSMEDFCIIPGSRN